MAEFGIGCESCHGPGEEHARRFRNPAARYAGHLGGLEDAAIVNPARLSHARSAEVCGQCHGLLQENTEADFHAWLKDGRRYRPGDKLSDSLLLMSSANRDHPELKDLLAPGGHYWDNRFWSDGMVRVRGREYNGLIESPCFQRGEMSCVSCHSMHQAADDTRPRREWANDQLASDKLGNHACTQCHEKFLGEEVLKKHTHHAASSVGSQCYNCHMPRTTYGLMKAIHSHEIDSPDVAVELATGRPNACNLCHLDKPLAWAGLQLDKWYGIEMPTKFSSDQREVAYAIERVTRGDAGQRALVAASMGWAPAHEAAGSSWMPPYLALLLDDSYRAVRYIGGRSLNSIPGFEDYKYDFIGPPEDRAAALNQVIAEWGSRNQQRGDQGARRDLHIDIPTLRRLLSERDNKPMLLNE